MTRQPANGPGNWVLLSYRMPREPSTPRITIWRKLKRLGVAQLSDGLIALPGDARTREHLDWIAEEIVESGGTATVWLAQPATLTQERELAAGMAAARSEEYRAVIDHAATAASGSEPDRVRTIRRLRDELRRIHRRDYFPPVERDTARLAVENLAGPRTKADSPKITP
jgi:hypothetical protein